MYQGVPTQQSCARAWVAACNKIITTGDEGYNIVVDVTNPFIHDDQDNDVISLVDKFLKAHEKTYPIITVANTIFPQSLYEAHGPKDFYNIYHRDLDSFSTTKQWGRYFQRITRHVDRTGNQINPLQEMIEKLKKTKKKGRCVKAVYEIAITPTDADETEYAEPAEPVEDYDITIYQPSRDRKRSLGGPCLSYLSFKRHPDYGLLLTVMYRNHYYITRLLGNLIGLGRLQKFVADQVDLKLGSLTVISTHAELDTGEWGIVEARELVDQANGILQK